MSKKSPLKNMLLLALRTVLLQKIGLHQTTYGKSHRSYGYGKPKRPRGVKGWLMSRALRFLDHNLGNTRR